MLRLMARATISAGAIMYNGESLGNIFSKKSNPKLRRRYMSRDRMLKSVNRPNWTEKISERIYHIA